MSEENFAQKNVCYFYWYNYNLRNILPSSLFNANLSTDQLSTR